MLSVSPASLEVNEFVWDNPNTHMIDCWSDVTLFHDAGTLGWGRKFQNQKPHVDLLTCLVQLGHTWPANATLDKS